MRPTERFADDGGRHLVVAAADIDQPDLLTHVEVVQGEGSLVQRVALGQVLECRDREIGFLVEFDLTEDLTSVGVFEPEGDLVGRVGILPLGSHGLLHVRSGISLLCLELLVKVPTTWAMSMRILS